MDCPWCGIGIEIAEVNCAIFRCGMMKATGQQINPHMSREEVAQIIGQIWGCGNPFKYINGRLVKCGWE